MANNGPKSSTDSISPSAKESTIFAFSAMTILFFIWGFITALNDILIPHLKATFELSYTQAMLVQFCFFGAYFVISPLAGKLIEAVSYKRGIVIGLLLMATGCALFYPAAEYEVYAVFLLALFVLASGITILQVSANPYVAILGSERTATSRLNFAQAINSLGHTLGPLFGALLIFGTINELATDSAKSVQAPYMILAVVIILIAIIFSRLKLPAVSSAVEDNAGAPHQDSLRQHRHLLWGALAIFLYVGAEVSIGSFLVDFFVEDHIAGLSTHDAAKLVSFYWGGAMLGRFIGAVATRYVRPIYVLAFNSVCAMTLLAFTISCDGDVAMWSVIAVGLFNSVMFPTIFTLAIRRLGPLTSRGSGLLCQAIVGGAFIPMIQGVMADSSSIQLSFIVPCCCYAYIIWYALKGSHIAGEQDSPDSAIGTT